MLKVDKVWSFLKQTNRDVNRMPAKTDMEMYGRADFWTSRLADAGDCDDYACIKRRVLRGKYPDHKHCFMLATCWVEAGDVPGGGDYHAVLLVRTDKGAYTLDNRHNRPMPWRKLPYKWHKREAPGKPYWRTFDD